MNQAQTPEYELRVLSGEQRGATSMVCSDTLRIGRDWSSDVVLQQADDSTALLVVDANGHLTLNVDAGECMIDGGVQLQAGEHASLEPYTPFKVGGVTVAVGQVGASGWETLFNNADNAGSDTSGEKTSDETPAPAGIWQTAILLVQAAFLYVQRLNWVKRLLLGAAVLVSASVGPLTLAWAIGAANLPLPEQAKNLRQTLAQAGAGFNTLGVETRDGLVVTGRLATLAQGSKLNQLLDKPGGGKIARSEVWIDEQVAANVANVYSSSHIAAEVKNTGPGVVLVKTHELDTAALAKATGSAREVQGLLKLDLVNDSPQALCSNSTIPDPGKRIADAVPANGPDDPAYIVTADGSHYFEGSLLPNGYRLVGIKPGGHIQLDCKGEVSDLTL